DFVCAMPVRVIRPHHGCTVTGTAALMMPDFVPREVDRIGELHRPEQWLGQRVQFETGLGELLVVLFNQTVVLSIEVIYPLLLVAVAADVLHRCPSLFPIDFSSGQAHLPVAVFGTSGDGWAIIPTDSQADIMRDGLILRRAHVAG